MVGSRLDAAWLWEKSFGLDYSGQGVKGAAHPTFTTEYERCKIDFVAKCTDTIWQLFQCVAWDLSTSGQVSMLVVLEKGNEKRKRNSEVVIEHDTNIDVNKIWPQIQLFNKLRQNMFKKKSTSNWINVKFGLGRKYRKIWNVI